MFHVDFNCTLFGRQEIWMGWEILVSTLHKRNDSFEWQKSNWETGLMWNVTEGYVPGNLVQLSNSTQIIKWIK